MRLSELKPKRGATHKKKRRGCGPGSGHGKTSTHGHKGHKARSGFRVKMGFEGGQNPLTRRLPKHGFVNIFKNDYEIVHLSQLNKFAANTVVTPELLVERGMTKNATRVKILSDGDIDRPLVVKAHAFSKKAEEKIIGAKGQVEKLK
jgi:large subunit ribosomal protein L15